MAANPKTADDTEKGEPGGVCRKVLAAAGIKAAPTDDYAMELINRHAIEHQKAEDVYAGQMQLANTRYDRTNERFPKSYLEKFAETLPGKALMPGHDYSALPIGRFYDAEVRRDPDTGGDYLHAKFYMPADSEHVPAIKMGVCKDASIGFLPDKRICDLDGLDYDGWQQSGGDGDGDWDDVGTGHKMDGEEGGSAVCTHIAGQTYSGRKCTLTYGGDTEKVEALEGSLVWLGCQYGAQTMSNRPPHAEKAAHVKALAPAASGKETQVDDKEKSAFLARQAELEAETARLTPLAADGEAYRNWQKDEIKRLYTSIGEKAAGEALLGHLASATGAELDKVRVEVDARHDAYFAKGGAQSGVPEGAAAERPSVNELLFGARARQGGDR